MAPGVSFLVFVLMTASCLYAAEVKYDKLHAPFGDLHEDISTHSSHRLFSKEDLSAFNGQKPDLPIYVAVKGVVFDVSEEKEFYGLGKPYNVLTGIDGSRAIAKWSMNPENLNGDLDGLSKQEITRLEEKFHNVYMSKYPLVGYLQGHQPRLDDDMLTRRKEDL